MTRTLLLITIAIFTLSACAGFGPAAEQTTTLEPTTSHIVKADSLADAKAAVTSVNGTITHELGVIGAVAAELTAGQLASLREDRAIRRIYGNDKVETAGKPTKPNDPIDEEDPGMAGSAYTEFPSLVKADILHAQGIDGLGVTIAIVDSGMYSGPGISQDRYGTDRVRAVYDATKDYEYIEGGRGKSKISFAEFDIDDNGHGSHVAGVASSGKLSDSGKYNGIAPAASLVAVKVFDAQGRGSYADVIRGIDWIVANRGKHDIDIINMSLSAQPRSHYWDDPLNQAVMAAWDAGIVVVASAGNSGPNAQSIGVPGNVPYVITVGAMTDNFTPSDGSDDRLATFSAAGPTYEGFVKPEVVGPGGHVIGSMESTDQIALDHPGFYLGASYYEMSGTSQATAVVSGVTALILQMEPGLSPDEVKCKLMHSAKPAVKADGTLAYSVFQQGAGMVDAQGAVSESTYDCANRGLDIQADLDGTMHFGGRANQDADGNYYLMGLDGYLWTDGGVDTNGYLWTDAYLWTDSLTEMATMSSWVDPE